MKFNGVQLKHNFCPKYLGNDLDRSLTFKTLLTKTAAKLRSRNNIAQKLTGTSWGASAHVLRTTILGLVYPTAEYCASVWMNSAHTNKIDVQLNQSMRLITGSIQSTPLYWLPTLSDIAPPDLRRKNILIRELNKIMANPELPIHDDINLNTAQRLKSRSSPLVNSLAITTENFNINDKWLEKWKNSAPIEWHPIKPSNTSERPPGFNLPRKLWCSLNRIRTNHGKCNDSFFKWGLTDSPLCDCNTANQTINHIAFDCPLRAYTGEKSDFITVPQDVINWIMNLDLQI